VYESQEKIMKTVSESSGSPHPIAVVLFSGGLDSTTCAAMAKSEGFDVCALSFYYHQRHKVEVEAARRVASSMGVRKHLVLELPLDQIGGSALTEAGIEVPKDKSPEEMQNHIPSTYVPARNTIFLSFALAWAEVLGSQDIFIGVNAIDYSGYPDCRPEYIEAFEKMANLGIRESVEGRLHIRLHTPLIRLTKAQIIMRGMELGIDYSSTHSCYDPHPSGGACGRCDSCTIRKRGFADAGLPDPTRYAD
jgi:7-cyano-7-deazaguanine synthase